MTADELSTELVRLTRKQREVLRLLAERTDGRSPDPGVTSGSATFADNYNVFVYWRTARALAARGLIDYPFKGGPDEGWSIRLTDAGWKEADRGCRCK